MLSLTHILLIGLVLLLVFGPTKIPALGRTFGESARNFKKALRGEEDIDVTHTVKRIEDENDQYKS
ncbi:MAG: twin-arginine translocase TatA/TatE family subunit [Bdellovibrionales bacterium]